MLLVLFILEKSAFKITQIIHRHLPVGENAAQKVTHASSSRYLLFELTKQHNAELESQINEEYIAALENNELSEEIHSVYFSSSFAIIEVSDVDLGIRDSEFRHEVYISNNSLEGEEEDVKIAEVLLSSV